jgi:predicted ATPase
MENKSLPRETLQIKHFLSLNNVNLEIKPFMVITGDIGSGKSLIIKLVEFFKDLFQLSIDSKDIHKQITKKFKDRFHLRGTEIFEIYYQYSFKEIIMNIKIFKSKESKSISVESKFLDSKKNKKLMLYQLLDSNLTNTYFVPAARAIFAISKKSKKSVDFHDHYLNEFYKGMNSIIEELDASFNNTLKKVENILNAEMKISKGDIHLLFKDGRKIEIANASSGQQEIAYVLLFVKLLESVENDNMHIFIEEPEAHLFPREQKLIMELIIKIYENCINEKIPIDFFITTHSPYVLNTINNCLIKGNIMKKNKRKKEQILDYEKTKEIPSLDYKNVAALFVNKDGGVDNILKEYDGDHVIDPGEINKISRDTMDDYNSLNNLKYELKNEVSKK